MQYPVIRYDDVGEGFPLLLLHGFTGSRQNWAAHLSAFAALRRVIAPDLIGHGASPAPPDVAAYTMERCVADLLALLDHLGIAQTDLLGYSMGGRVALQLTAAAPHRVRRLILESAAPGISDPGERAARVASDHALAAQIEAQGMAWFADYWAAIPLFASQATLPPAVRAAQRAHRLAQRPHGLANSLRGMGAGAQTSLWERLDQITTPTLLISGALDAKYVQIGTQMATLLPHAQQIIVPNAGHTVHLEQPQAFREIVVEYLYQC
jgi:2-succinyl-6-hydroxy-2,4-cyclohexadiene-1-carboxylate synthase